MLASTCPKQAYLCWIYRYNLMARKRTTLIFKIQVANRHLLRQQWKVTTKWRFRNVSEMLAMLVSVKCL